MESTSTCIAVGTSTDCTISQSYFTSGEMFMSLLLLILIVLKIFEIVRQGIFTIKQKRKFTGNNSQMGKEEYDI